ncbi:MAG: hypothetical protein AAF399_14480, partial [Bacteroidota bacterium]
RIIQLSGRYFLEVLSDGHCNRAAPCRRQLPHLASRSKTIPSLKRVQQNGNLQLGSQRKSKPKKKKYQMQK